MPDRFVVGTQQRGAILRVALNAPPGNILDIRLLDDLRRTIAAKGGARAVKAILLESAGREFCWGTSIEEHRRPEAARMLRAFHGLIRALARLDRFLVAVVRGRCLGGGLELAAFCHRVFAHPEARFGQPEIALGVFPPLASVILPLRCGRAATDDLCVSGRTVSAREALGLGLVDIVTRDPQSAADRYIAEHLLPKSASSLSHTVRAARAGFNRALDGDLRRAERHYLRDLMRTHDANEGIEAFLAKRPPRWKDR